MGAGFHNETQKDKQLTHMETVRSIAVRAGAGLLASLACLCGLSSCDGMMFDGEGDCSVNYKVRFVYDYNMKYADAFAHEVSRVTLYLVDESGAVVWQKTEEGDALAEAGYTMDVDVEPGTYSLLAWCGSGEGESFSIPSGAAQATELTCTLNRKRDAEGTAYSDTDLDRLFHGYEASQEFPDEAGTYWYTVNLTKDTNVFHIVLQHVSGGDVDKDSFAFSITDENGAMDWDNSLLPDETMTYLPWHTAQTEAEMYTDDTTEKASEAEGGTRAQTRAVFSGALAELTTARLMAGNKPRLTVTNKETGKTAFSYPLIELATMVKNASAEYGGMSDQEYLDRQDEYDVVIFLDEGDRWVSVNIYIESWYVVLQNTSL